MRRLIRGLWSWLSGYHHGWRGVADRCSACVGGFIRVGLESAVIKARGGETMRSFTNLFGDLPHRQYGRIVVISYSGGVLS